MTSKIPMPDVRLSVRFEDDPSSWGSRYCHVYVTPVILARAEHGRQEYTAWDVDSYSIPEAPASVRALKGLKVRAQMDDSTARQPGSAGFYGYRLSFALDEIDLQRAEIILPVLRKIDRKMTALSDRFGHPRDLVTFLGYLTDALGLTGQPFVRTVDAEHDYEGHGHRSMSIDMLGYWLADETKKWRERHGITVSDAA
jgi:hypothetical protein